jgi:hypothetical protein
MGKSYKRNYSDSMYDGFGNRKGSVKKQKRFKSRDILDSYYNRDEDDNYDNYKRKGYK